MNKQKLTIIIPCVLAMLSTFFPWIEEFGHQYKGVEMDGWITLVLFATTIVICIGGNMKAGLERKFKLGIYGSSGLATIIALSKILKSSSWINQALPDSFKFTVRHSWHIEPALYLATALGLLVIIFTAVIQPDEEKDA